MKNLTLVILFFISSIITCNAQEPTQYTKAVELLQQGKQDSLKVYLENWENTEPKQAEIYALNSYLNILKNTPNDYLVVFNVAYLYETLGDYKNAKKYYKMVKKSRDPQISQQATEALDYLKNNK